jgi:methyl-accepting chemotaxis protein
MRLHRLRLGLRITLGFGLLVVLMLGISALSAMQLSGDRAQFATLGELATNKGRVWESVSLLESIGFAEAQFRMTGEPSLMDEAVRNEARAAELLRAAATTAISAQRKAAYLAVATDIETSAAARVRFATAQSAGFAERATLFAAGDILTAATAELVAAAAAGHDAALGSLASQLETAVLLVRVANWRFLATLDSKGVASFAGKAKAANEALAAVAQRAPAELKPQLTSVEAALRQYESGFARGSHALLDGVAIYDQDVQPMLRGMRARLGEAAKGVAEAADLSQRNMQETMDSDLWRQLALSGVVVLLGIGLALLIGRSITRPVTGMTAAMQRLAEGNHSVSIPARDNTDEIGDMARAVEVFKQNAIENAAMMRDREQEAAAKARRQVAMDHRTKDFGISVSGVMTSLLAAAATMRHSAEQVAEAAEGTRNATSGTVAGANESVRDLSSVAAATEEMAVSSTEISKQVSHVTSAVRAAVERATATDSKVVSLAQAAERIGDVVRLITDIAGRTNLLALNATIEAARAGEAGRGFAVVAGEVKALAAQTARATEQIGTQIVAIRDATGEAVASVRDVASAIGQVEAVATAIAAAVEEQAAATREITNSVQLVTTAMSGSAAAMERVLTIAESTDTTSRAALTAADEVGQTADTLRKEVGDFLAAMSSGEDGERREFDHRQAPPKAA